MHDAAEQEGLGDAAAAGDVEAATRAAALRVALARYETTRSPAMLDQAFVAAAAAVAVVRGERAAEPADVEELRALIEKLPEFGELVGTVVGEAERWAAQLTEELCHRDEGLWRRVFGERYDLMRTRYAPRTAWRKRELSTVLATDSSTVDALRRRLAAWFVQSRDLERLPTELEAAFIETRTPARLA